MVLPDSISPENAIGSGIAGIVIAYFMVRKYLKEWNSPTSPTGDRIIPSLAIADMKPVRDLAEAQERCAAADERIATALEKMLALSQERAEDAEIVRRAEIMAQEMLKQLQVTEPHRRRPTRS